MHDNMAPPVKIRGKAGRHGLTGNVIIDKGDNYRYDRQRLCDQINEGDYIPDGEPRGESSGNNDKEALFGHEGADDELPEAHIGKPDGIGGSGNGMPGEDQ